MSWNEHDLMSLRSEFVMLASQDERNMAELCRRFGISRKTGYKWLKRYQAQGASGLKDQSRRPRSSPKQTPRSMELEILSVREQHPAWGGRKIRKRLEKLDRKAVPAASTITQVLWRHQQISPDDSRNHTPWRRFEHPRPNDLWQMDFKGEFRMSNQQWCYPLTVLDDHSRFALSLRACSNQRRETVQQALTDLFRRYGLPQAMLMDNGTPWASPNRIGGHTKLSVWLMRLDILVWRGRPFHPQTQGKEERFHRTLDRELLREGRFDDLEQTQSRFDPFREMYNQERPHEALGLEVPASRYRMSARSYPEALPEIVYDVPTVVRKVGPSGQFQFQGQTHKISEAFAGEQVGLDQIGERQWRICLGRIPIAELDQSRPAGSQVINPTTISTAQTQML